MALELLRTSERPGVGFYSVERNGGTLNVSYCMKHKPDDGLFSRRTAGTGKYESWGIAFLKPDGKARDMHAFVYRRPGSPGYSYGLFELCIFEKEDKVSDIFAKDWGANSLGYLSEEEVVRWIDKLMNLMGYND